MRASKCEIVVGGRVILTASDVEYDGKELSLSGLTFKGAVSTVSLPELEREMLDYLGLETSKNLEIRLRVL